MIKDKRMGIKIAGTKFINFKFVIRSIFKASPIINNDQTPVILAITMSVKKGAIKLARRVTPP